MQNKSNCEWINIIYLYLPPICKPRIENMAPRIENVAPGIENVAPRIENVDLTLMNVAPIIEDKTRQIFISCSYMYCVVVAICPVLDVKFS